MQYKTFDNFSILSNTLDPVGFTRDCNDWLAFFRGRHSSSVLHTIYSQVNLLATFQCYRVMLVGILSLKIGVVEYYVHDMVECNFENIVTIRHPRKKIIEKFRSKTVIGSVLFRVKSTKNPIE